MPLNPNPPVTRVETVSRFAAKHNEAVCLVVGFLLGAVVTLLAVWVG